MISVYICLPYGDHNSPEQRLANTQRAMQLWHELADSRAVSSCEANRRTYTAAFAPFCPHLSHFLHEYKPRPRHEWLRHCLYWVQHCSCLLAIGEPTEGMQLEIFHARELGKPVFRTVQELVRAYGE